MNPRKVDRCGKYMPRKKTYCAMTANHTGRCRTEEGLTRQYDASVAYARRIYSGRLAWLDAYKLARGCSFCGYGRDGEPEQARALDFDHQDTARKLGIISHMARHVAWELVLAEIQKCTILCANCHRIKTFASNDHKRRRPAVSPED